MQSTSWLLRMACPFPLDCFMWTLRDNLREMVVEHILYMTFYHINLLNNLFLAYIEFYIFQKDKISSVHLTHHLHRPDQIVQFWTYLHRVKKVICKSTWHGRSTVSRKYVYFMFREKKPAYTTYVC